MWTLSTWMCSLFVIGFPFWLIADTETTLSIGSGSGLPGGTVVLDVGLKTSNQITGLQWTLSYSAADFTAVSVAAGPAATTAGKSVTCNNSAGAKTCLVTGLNVDSISSGTVARVTLTISPTITRSSASISVNNPIGVTPENAQVAISGAHGLVMIQQAPIVVTMSSCTPTAIDVLTSASCAVTLSAVASSGGIPVALSSSNAAVSVPHSITVAAGSSTASFSASANAVSTDTPATITATLNGTSSTTSVSVIAQAGLSSVACTPASIRPGETAACTVTLSKAAAGVSVALWSNNAAVSVAPSVTVAAVSSTAIFSASANSVVTDTSATITATVNGVVKAARSLCHRARVPLFYRVQSNYNHFWSECHMHGHDV